MQDTCDNFNIKNGDSKFNNPLLAGIWNLQKRGERKTSLELLVYAAKIKASVCGQNQRWLDEISPPLHVEASSPPLHPPSSSSPLIPAGTGDMSCHKGKASIVFGGLSQPWD
jgi:hypothetical protein